MNRFSRYRHFLPTLSSISALLASSAVLFSFMLVSHTARADTFGNGANIFNIEFVDIGDPGNAADTTGDPNPAGAVDYEYRIGKYEISEEMIDKANAQSALEGNPLGITHDGRGPNKPATRVSWFEAARFVNWLNTNQDYSPAYKFDTNGDFQLWAPGDAGYDPNNLFRNSGAAFFLPSADEWYKAAFYDPISDQWFDFPNGSNTAPLPVASGTDLNTAVIDQPFSGGIPGDTEPAEILLAGGPSPFGTVAQAGNVWEWEETEVDLVNGDPVGNRGARGGAWTTDADSIGITSSARQTFLIPGNEFGDLGFRIASIPIPEPTTHCLTIYGGIALLVRRRSRPNLEPA